LGENITLSLGGSLTTNIAGTDGLSDMIGIDKVSKKAMGLGSFISLSAAGAFLEGEVVLSPGDIKLPDGGTLNPLSFNIEIGYSLPGTSVEIAGKFEQLSMDRDNSTNRFGGMVSIRLFGETASLALEFLRADDGDNAENSVVSQLAVEF